jgi:hypothetical protein
MPKGNSKKTTTTANVPAKRERPARDRDQLLAAIGEQFDAVDALMAKPKRADFNPIYPGKTVPGFSAIHIECHQLFRELEKNFRAEHADDFNAAIEAMDTATLAMFSDPKGESPRWSRRGSFLVWLDYIPVRCDWPGVLNDAPIEFHMVDPRQMFFTERGEHAARASNIPGAIPSPEQLIRSLLSMRNPSMQLVRPTPDAVEAAGITLANEPWLAEALARGPERPLPLPRHLQAIQRSLLDLVSE